MQPNLKVQQNYSKLNYNRLWRNSCAIFMPIFLVLSFIVQTGAEIDPNQTPVYIKPCSASDPELNKCIVNSLDHLKYYLIQGIPELNIPPLEPFKIKKLAVNNGNGPVRIQAIFSNITVYGAANNTIDEISGNVTGHNLIARVRIPRMQVTGSYDINGNVLLFPVKSVGDFWAMFVNISGIGTLIGKEIVKNGIRYMKVDKLQIDFKLGRASFKIKDHINGNNVIGEAMNQFLNQNALEIIDEVKPAAIAAISKHLKSFLNAAISQVPLDIWLKP